MTTTVTVKARAHGAIATLRAVGNAANAQDFLIAANTEQTFHLTDTHALEVKQGSPAVEEDPVEETIFAASAEDEFERDED